MSSINDDKNNNNSALIQCKICASANDCPPADAARLFSADDLLKHIHVHLNYRPHQCKNCNFAATSPLELFDHSQKAEHFDLSFFNARNVFIEEMAQFALDECMKQQHPHIKGTGDNVPPTDDNERAKLIVDDSAVTATPPRERMTPLLDASACKLELEEQIEPTDMDISDGEQLHVDQDAGSVGVGQQNLSPFQKAFQDCVRGVSKVLASFPANALIVPVPAHVDHPANAAGTSGTKIPKTECDEPAAQQQDAVVGVGSDPKRMILSTDRCAECSGIFPDIPAVRLHHTNVRHLKLSLYKCPFCSKEFPYVIYGIGHCKQHIRSNHPGMPMPSDEEFPLPNLSEKMKKIRARAVSSLENLDCANMRCPMMLIICCSLLHQFVVGQNEDAKPVRLTGKHLKMSQSIEYRAPDQCMPYMQNPNEAKTFGLSFRFHHDGGRCDDGLLICYPGTLDTVTAGNWPNMVTVGQFRVGNAQNPGNFASRNCTEKWKNDGMNNGSSSAVWHGLYVYTKPVGNDSRNTIMQMSISPKEYNFGPNDHFTVHFGNRDDIFTYATPDFDDSVADETLRITFLQKARKGAFLKDFVGLWMLGLDILPFSNLYQIELHIYRSCNCLMEAWFTKPIDSEEPHDQDVSAGSHECHQFTNKTYPIKHAPPKDHEDLKIRIMALTDVDLEGIVVKLGDSKKNTIMEFEVGTNKSLNVSFPGKEPYFLNSVLLQNGSYEMKLRIEVHAFNYEILLNDTRLGNRLFWPPNWWDGLRRNKIKQIELNGQMLLLKAPTVEVVVPNSTWATNVYTKFYQIICRGTEFTFRVQLIGTENFNISLLHDRPEFHNKIGSTVLEIDVKPSNSNNSLNFNSLLYGIASNMSRKDYTFKPDNVYEFKIVINDNKYEFHVNGKRAYVHKEQITPAWAINFVRVEGNVNRMEEPSMKAGQCEKGRTQNISKTLSSLLNYGDVVKIDGHVKHGAKQFKILLLHEAAEFNGNMGDVPLKLVFDFMDATINCTHWLYGNSLSVLFLFCSDLENRREQNTWPVLFLFLFCSCSVPVLFLFCSCSVPVLFLFCSCSVPVLFLFCSCSVPVLFLFCSCSVPVLLFLFCSCSVVPVLFLFCSYFCSCSVPVLFLFCSCSVLFLFCSCSVPVLFLFCSCSVPVLLFLFCSCSVPVLFLIEQEQNRPSWNRKTLEKNYNRWANGINASFTELKLYEGQHLKLEILMADDGFYGSIHGTRFNKFCNYYMAYFVKTKSIMPIPPFAIDHIRVEGDLEVDPDHILVEPQTLAINDTNGANISWTKRIRYKQINRTDDLLQLNESIIVVLELDRVVPQEVCVFFYSEALAYHDLVGKTVLKVLLNNKTLIFSRHYPRYWNNTLNMTIAEDSKTFKKANMLTANAKLNFTITVKEISKFELLLNGNGTDDNQKDKLVYKQTVEWPLPVWATHYITANYTAGVSIKSLEVFCVPEKRCTTKNGTMLGGKN
uniref:Galectin domain-containing protein n=1 Tax=Globodera rostochiensis TaxID=31243 RepID=A0A914GTD2_GLORO